MAAGLVRHLEAIINMLRLLAVVVAFMCLHKLLMLCTQAAAVAADLLTGGVVTTAALEVDSLVKWELKILIILTVLILEKVEPNQQAAPERPQHILLDKQDLLDKADHTVSVVVTEAEAAADIMVAAPVGIPMVLPVWAVVVAAVVVYTLVF
jgi:hypothetical protein